MKVLTVFGTRPEAIKIAPLIKKLESVVDLRICVTGQHKEMLSQVLNLFEIHPDYDLKIMKPNQSLNSITSKIIESIDLVYEDFKPNLVLVHGDTTTSFAASLAAFHRKILIGHVEAGLRTHNLQSPYPEEANRKLTSVLANFHFAPTETAKQNLLNEGISKKAIVVTGNTVIDSLFLMKEKILHHHKKELDRKFSFLKEKIVLITGHRRENFLGDSQNICQAIKNLSEKFPNIDFIYPVHLSPNVQNKVNQILLNIDNVHLIPPLDYLSFVYLMMRSLFIMTDSGGIQEEAPSLGKYVFVMRDTTERPEAVDAGTAFLTGVNPDKITSIIEQFLKNNAYHEKILHNPYGDGMASSRIVKFLLERNL